MYNVQFFISIDKETLVKDRNFGGVPPWSFLLLTGILLVNDIETSRIFENSVKNTMH